MNEGTKAILAGAIVVLGIIALSWVGMANSVAIKRTFGVADANAEREIYENTKGFQDGTIKALRDYQMDYLKSTSEDHKAGMREIIVSEADKISEDKLPQDLKKFVQDIKEKRRNTL